MKKMIFLLGMLILFTSSIVIALQGGSANSYSTDASKYGFYTTHNGTNGAAIPNAESGHTITTATQAGTAWAIQDNAAFADGSATATSYCITFSEVRQNRTDEVWLNFSGTLDASFQIHADNATACPAIGGAAIEAFRLGTEGNEWTLRDGTQTTNGALEKPSAIKLGEN
ncbi:MAG: hypothetical protein HZA83_02825, partial [Thaumarchaeota archaeon]|nr:hypothetical protein [Nitrososphaerota archaeon]